MGKARLGKGRALSEDKKDILATTITGVQVGERKWYLLSTGAHRLRQFIFDWKTGDGYLH
jgi:hypothetical protein